jgi:hypothetical protein
MSNNHLVVNGNKRLTLDADMLSGLEIPRSVKMRGVPVVNRRYPAGRAVTPAEDAEESLMPLRAGATVPVVNAGIGYLARRARVGNRKAPGTFADMTGQPGDSVQAGGEEHSPTGQSNYVSEDPFTSKVKLPIRDDDDEDEDDEDTGPEPEPLDADGNAQYSDFGPTRSMTPAEMVGFSMSDDDLARENRKRQGLPVEYAEDGEMQPPSSMADIIARSGGWYDNRR